MKAEIFSVPYQNGDRNCSKMETKLFSVPYQNGDKIIFCPVSKWRQYLSVSPVCEKPGASGVGACTLTFWLQHLFGVSEKGKTSV